MTTLAPAHPCFSIRLSIRLSIASQLILIERRAPDDGDNESTPKGCLSIAPRGVWGD